MGSSASIDRQPFVTFPVPVNPTMNGPSLLGVPSFAIRCPMSRREARSLPSEGSVCGRGVYYKNEPRPIRPLSDLR